MIVSTKMLVSDGISAAVVVAVIAMALITDEENARNAKQRRLICDEAMRNPDDQYRIKVLDACVQLTEQAQENMKPPTGAEGINKALQILALGLVAYGAVLMLPHFTKAFGQAKLRKGAAREAHKPVPPARYRPAIYQAAIA